VTPTLTEGPSLVEAVLGILINLALPLALFAWGRSLANRRGGRGFRLASYMPLGAMAASMLGLGLTIVGLVQAFGAVEGTDASSRATVLSNGIATAMWATAIGVGASLVLYVASIVTFTVGELTKPKGTTVSRP
jgi:hypothetical protein